MVQRTLQQHAHVIAIAIAIAVIGQRQHLAEHALPVKQRDLCVTLEVCVA